MTETLNTQPWKTAVEQARSDVQEFNIGELIRHGFIPLDGDYYCSITYPPLAKYPSFTGAEFAHYLPSTNIKPLSVYFHIPFCIQKCVFCHFFVEEKASEQAKDTYLSGLENEIKLYRDFFSLSKIPAESVLIGGGTATNISVIQLKRLMGFLEHYFCLDQSQQFTMDVDPTTLLGSQGKEKLRILKRSGVTRLSIGAQSFNDNILKSWGRQHTALDIVEAVKNSYAAGIENVSLDLIYGFPGQTLHDWFESLHAASKLDVGSIQLYRLRFKPYGLVPGKITKHTACTSVTQELLEDTLIKKVLGRIVLEKHGYSDNFFTRLFAKKNNNISLYGKLQYDQLHDVLGFGVSAYSSIGNVFGVNRFDSINEYCNDLTNRKLPIAFGKQRTADDEKRRQIVAPLKNSKVVLKREYRLRTGEDLSIFSKTIQRLKQYDLLAEDKESISLTRRGCFFADEVCLQFYAHEYLPFSKDKYADGVLNPFFG